MARVERLLAWLDRNFQRLLVLGLFANVAAIFGQLLYYAAGEKTFEDVAREEIRRWLSTHNVTVVVQKPTMITMPSDVLLGIIALMGLAMLLTAIISRC